MKYDKRIKALLVMLASVSMLPGCGKSSNNAATGAVSSGSYGVSTIGSGSCVTVTYGVSQTLTFYGSLTQGGSGIQANLSAYGYGGGGFGGSNYYRNLSTGDSTNVYVSSGTAYATLTISANTASAIVQGQAYYGTANGNAQVCGISINESIFASPVSGQGYSGTMGGGQIYLWGNNSYITYGPQYGNQLILF